MNSWQIAFIIVSFIVGFHKASAYIFLDYDSDSVNLMNFEYDSDCAGNETIATTVNKFATKYEKIKRLSRSDVKLIRRKGFETVSANLCEKKRDLAKSMAMIIQPIAIACVKDETIRKKFGLNTLLLVDTALDFICSQTQSHYEHIYEWHSEKCLSDSSQLLASCQRKSFDLYFWETVPDKLPTVAQLINGAVCDFDFDKMLSCSTEVVTTSKSFSCSIGAIELISYQLDVIKRNSLCFKPTSISENIDSSSEDSSDIVS